MRPILLLLIVVSVVVGFVAVGTSAAGLVRDLFFGFCGLGVFVLAGTGIFIVKKVL